LSLSQLLISFAKLNEILMTYRQLLETFKQQLANHYDSHEIESVFYLVLEKVSGFKRLDFFMNESDQVNDLQLNKFDSFINELQLNKPVQYVLGEAWFNEHKYMVNESVLVPRPETEELIHLISKLKPRAQNIIDIGTGSGCIAIELSLLYKKKVIAVDISLDAIKVASKNAKELRANVEFKHYDILTSNYQPEKKFDIIASNPPYVMKSEKRLMNENVLKYEPETALFVEDHNPLIFYKAIRDFSLEYAEKGALIAMEINEQLGNETADLFAKGFKNIQVHKDIHGKERMLTAHYE
jgi:release factor glutamine methyltransferase